MSFDLQLLNGDISLDNTGQFNIVANTPKLVQDVVKFVTTSLGSNKYQPAIGSLISQRLIGQNLTQATTVSVLQSSVQEALQLLQKLQQQQAQKQALSPAETLVALNAVTVTQSVQDPRQLNVTIQITAGDGNLYATQIQVML